MNKLYVFPKALIRGDQNFQMMNRVLKSEYMVKKCIIYKTGT